MKEDYLERIKYFGIKAQKRKFSEESNELRDAIVEYEISRETFGGAKMKQLKEHIAEEIADNLALLKQFQLFYEIEDDEIKKWLKFKNERTNERIKTKYYE